MTKKSKYMTSLLFGAGVILCSCGQMDPEPQAYAEISVKDGGQWEERVYQGGKFVNIDNLDLPQEHTDHSGYIRYEGPGWESEQIGYRLYLDWRNAIDVFGKKTYQLALKDVGQDGFDSYHEMQDWGMDILKVGESLGLGSFGNWALGKAWRVSDTDSISCSVEDGQSQASVRIRYAGWQSKENKVDLDARISIHSGDRISFVQLNLSGPVDSLCTGIVKHPEAELIPVPSANGWGCLATWGKQSLVPDHMGMAVFYPLEELLELAEDSLNHIVVLDGSDSVIDYGFLAVWEKEPAAWTLEKFREYLESKIEELDNPLELSMKKDLQ